MGVPVLAPEINSSFWDFSIEDIEIVAESDNSSKKTKPHIRFGLGAIKNVGETAVQLIIDEREANGKFVDLNEFARRVDLRAVGNASLNVSLKLARWITLATALLYWLHWTVWLPLAVITSALSKRDR